MTTKGKVIKVEQRVDELERIVLEYIKQDTDSLIAVSQVKATRAQLNRAHDRITRLERGLLAVAIALMISLIPDLIHLFI